MRRVRSLERSLCVSGCVLSHIWLFVSPWTVASQAPLSMGFSRQNCWSGLHALLRGSSQPRDQTLTPCPLHHRWILHCLAIREAYIHYCFVFFFLLFTFLFFSQVLSFIIIIIIIIIINWSPSISIFFVWWLANCKIIIVILYIYIFTIIWQMLTPFKAQLDVPTVKSWVLQEGESKWEGREKARPRINPLMKIIEIQL